MYKEVIEKEIEMIQNQGMVEPASSEWAPSIVIIKEMTQFTVLMGTLFQIIPHFSL